MKKFLLVSLMAVFAVSCASYKKSCCKDGAKQAESCCKDEKCAEGSCAKKKS